LFYIKELKRQRWWRWWEG